MRQGLSEAIRKETIKYRLPMLQLSEHRGQFVLVLVSSWLLWHQKCLRKSRAYFSSQPITEKSQGRHSSRLLKQKPWGNTASWLSPGSCLAPWFYSAQDYLPRVGAAQKGPGSLTSTNNQDSSPQMCLQGSLIEVISSRWRWAVLHWQSKLLWTILQEMYDNIYKHLYWNDWELELLTSSR